MQEGKNRYDNRDTLTVMRNMQTLNNSPVAAQQHFLPPRDREQVRARKLKMIMKDQAVYTDNMPQSHQFLTGSQQFQSPKRTFSQND